MKSEQRHQLQQNALAAWLVEAVEWCKQNAPLLLGAVIGLALTVGAVTYFRHRSQAGAVAEWSDFFSAAGRQDTIKLESIGVVDAGDVTGQLANLMLADTGLVSGVDLMSTDRASAEEQLNAAKNKYAKVRQTARDPLLKQRALLGLARYYETVGLLDEAIQEYTTLSTEFPDGLFTEQAKQKIAYLREPGTMAFSQWYKQHKPLPPEPAGTAGMPNLGDLNKLPSDESSFPGAFPGGTAK
jgi:hypothetical protein